MAIAVEIPHRQGAGTVGNLVLAQGLEGTVALAEQDTHETLAIIVDHRKGGDAIAIEVPHRVRYRGDTGARRARSVGGRSDKIYRRRRKSARPGLDVLHGRETAGTPGEAHV